MSDGGTQNRGIIIFKALPHVGTGVVALDVEACGAGHVGEFGGGEGEQVDNGLGEGGDSGGQGRAATL